MFYSHSGEFRWRLFVMFTIISILLVAALRNQFLIGDEDWLKRMISHHSTALTTSHKIQERTNNKELKKLASDIIDTQEKEIALMKSMFSNKSN